MISVRIFGDASEAEDFKQIGELLEFVRSHDRLNIAVDSSVGFAPAGSDDGFLDEQVGEYLSERPRNILTRNGVTTFRGVVGKTEDDLLAMTNMGQRSVDEIQNVLESHGHSLKAIES